MRATKLYLFRISPGDRVTLKSVRIPNSIARLIPYRIRPTPKAKLAKCKMLRNSEALSLRVKNPYPIQNAIIHNVDTTKLSRLEPGHPVNPPQAIVPVA